MSNGHDLDTAGVTMTNLELIGKLERVYADLAKDGRQNVNTAIAKGELRLLLRDLRQQEVETILARRLSDRRAYA